MTDHYQTLCVERDSSFEEIKASYRRLAMRWHPDRHQSQSDKSEAEVKFKAVQQAYEVLSDAYQRSQYDHLLAQQDYAASHSNQFEDWSRQYQNERTYTYSSHLPRGSDVVWKTTVTLKTATEGGEIIYTRKERRLCGECEGEREFDFVCPTCGGQGGVKIKSDWRYCPQCHGDCYVYLPCDTCAGKGHVSESISTRIRVPAGLVDGTEITASHLGKPSRFIEGLRGDLHIKIAIKPIGGFKFSGKDINGPIKVAFSIALLGGQMEFDLPTGRSVVINIPARSNSGKKIRLTGLGLRARDGSFGDAILSVVIVLPRSKRKLTPAEEFVLRSLD